MEPAPNDPAGRTLSPDAVAAIVLNYNGARDTIACLRALYALASPPGWIVVVDNRSTDDSAARIRAVWSALSGAAPVLVPADRDSDPGAALPCAGAIPRPVFVLSPRNNGYAAGNNLGILPALRTAGCRACWILNNDALPGPHALQALCDALHVRPGAGLAGSTLLTNDGRRVQCAGGASLNPFLGTMRSLGAFLPVEKLAGLAEEAVNARLDFVTGASMLARREVFERIGLLPEEYFLYYEDAEFGLRAKRAGFAPVWARDSLVRHRDGGSSRAPGQARLPAWVEYMAWRNRVWFARKMFSPFYLPFILAGYAGVAVKRVLRKQADRLPLILHAVRDGLRGAMGRPPRGISRVKCPAGICR
jgi:GT2 family glycosyltransferase